MVLSERAKDRRQEFIDKCDLEQDEFKSKLDFIILTILIFTVLSNGGNDSMAFKTSFYDFRGEKGRDKTLDISPERFNTTSF